MQRPRAHKRPQREHRREYGHEPFCRNAIWQLALNLSQKAIAHFRLEVGQSRDVFAASSKADAGGVE
jgi:hypothetical protein